MPPTRRIPISPAQVLANARALVAERETLHSDAQDHEADVLSRLRAGDDSVAVNELVEAEVAVRRATMLLEAAHKAVAPAERAAELTEAQANPTLAHWLKDVIDENLFEFGLFGFAVHVVPALPAKFDAPAVYLFQAEPTFDDGVSGILAGTVRLVVAVPDSVRFRGEQIQIGIAEVIDRTGMAKTTVFSSGQGSVHHVNVKLEDVKPAIPTTPEDVDEHWLQELAYDANGEAFNACMATEKREATAGEKKRARLETRVAFRRLVKQERINGLVRRTVAVGVTVSALQASIDFTAAERAIKGMKGGFAPGLGRIKEVHILDKDWTKLPEYSPKDELTVSAQYVTIARPLA